MLTKKAAPKKKAAKKTAKKPAKKPAVKKAVKSAKPKAKAGKKTSAKKSTKKAVAQPQPVVVVKAVNNSYGGVTVKSVDDPGQASDSKGSTVKPTLDKETGIVTMVPDTED